MKYCIIFDDDNNIINQPFTFVQGSYVATTYNYLVGTKETILMLFPEAIFSDVI